MRGAAESWAHRMVVCGLRVSTQEGCGLGRAEELPGARGEHGDAADPEVRAMMPLVDVALDHKKNGRTKRRMWSTWATNARLTSTTASAAAAGCLSAR